MIKVLILYFAITSSLLAAGTTRLSKVIGVLCSDEQELRVTPCLLEKGKKVPTISNFSDDGVKILAKINESLIAKNLTHGSLESACTEARNQSKLNYKARRKNKDLPRKKSMITFNNIGVTLPTKCICRLRKEERKNRFCDQASQIDKVSLLIKAKAYNHLKKYINKSIVEYREFSPNKLECNNLSNFDKEKFIKISKELEGTKVPTLSSYNNKKTILQNISTFDQDKLPSNTIAPIIPKNDAFLKYLYKGEHKVDISNELLNQYKDKPNSTQLSRLKVTFPKMINRVMNTDFLKKIKDAGGLENYAQKNANYSHMGGYFLANLGSSSADTSEELKDFEASLFLTKGISRYFVSNNSDKIVDLIKRAIINNKTLEGQIIQDAEEVDTCANIDKAIESFNKLVSKEPEDLITTLNRNLFHDKDFFNNQVLVNDKDDFFNKDRNSFLSTSSCFERDSERSYLFGLEADAISFHSGTDRSVTSISSAIELVENFKVSAQNVKKKIKKIKNKSTRDEVSQEFNDYADDFYKFVTGRSYSGGFNIMHTPIIDYASLMKLGAKTNYFKKSIPTVKELVSEQNTLKNEFISAKGERKEEIRKRLKAIDADLSTFEKNGIDVSAIRKNFSSFNDIQSTARISTQKAPRGNDNQGSEQIDRRANPGNTETTATSSSPSSEVSINNTNAQSSVSNEASSSKIDNPLRPYVSSQSSTGPRQIFLLKSQKLETELEKIDNEVEADSALIVYEQKTDSFIKILDDKTIWKYNLDEMKSNISKLDLEERTIVLSLLEQRNRYKTKVLNSLMHSTLKN